MTRRIVIAEQCTSEVGNCNGCTERSGPGQRYRVWDVRLCSMSFRLCDACIVHFHDAMIPSVDKATNALSADGGAGVSEKPD